MIILRNKSFAESEGDSGEGSENTTPQSKVTMVKEKARSIGHKAVNYAIDNPVDTAAWALGDVYLPGKIAGELSKRLGGGWKGKTVKGVLYGYAASPFGLTTLGINAKNKWKQKHKKENDNK